MCFKLAIKEIKRNWKINFFMVVQIIMFVIIILLSERVLEKEISYYWNFKDFFLKEGVFVASSTGSFLSSNGEVIQGSPELEQELKHAEVLGSYLVGSMYEKSGEFLQLSGIAYDEEIIKSLRPEMKAGEWIGKLELSPNIIQAVVTENDLGLNVGDRIKMGVSDFYSEDENYKVEVEIIGILPKEEKFFGISGTGETFNYRNLYDYNKNDECKIFFSKKNLDKIFFKKKANSIIMLDKAFIFFEQGTTSDDIEYNMRYLKQKSEPYIFETLQNLDENSKIYLKRQLFKYLPSCIYLGIFVLMTFVIARCILIKVQEKNYQIYYICGCRKKQCCFINDISIGILCFFAFFISYFSILIVKKDNMAISFQDSLICIIFLIGMWLISSIFARAVISSIQFKVDRN